MFDAPQTAGLVVAARLSEDPATSVLVLEAGAANLDDPNLSACPPLAPPCSSPRSFIRFIVRPLALPATYGKVFKDPNYDWAFTTVPQKHADNNTYLWDRCVSPVHFSTPPIFIPSVPTSIVVASVLLSNLSIPSHLHLSFMSHPGDPEIEGNS